MVDSVTEEGGWRLALGRRPCPAPGVAFPDRPLPTEGAESEESSGEADGDAEAEAWGLADVRELHPGLLAHRAARARDLPALAAALAHGAEVNWADAEDEGKTPLVQAVLGVSEARGPRAGHSRTLEVASSVAPTQGPPVRGGDKFGPGWGRPRPGSGCRGAARGRYRDSVLVARLPRAP